MDDLISEFLTETNESLEELDLDLVNLEQNPNDADLLGKIFRLMHTIKGTCGFLGLPRLEKVAHHAENVLGRFRDGDLEVTADYVTLIFESIDRIKLIVGGLEETGSEPEGDDSALIAQLDEVYEGKASAPAAEEAPAQDAAPEPEAPAEDAGPAQPEPDEHGFVPVPAGTDFSQADDSAAPAAEETPAEEPATAEAEPAPEAAPAPPPPAAAKKEEPAAAAKSEGGGVTQTLRVNVDVLENLMTMVSEMVLTRNQLLQILRAQSGECEFSGPLQRLNHVVSDLQEGVMKTRMQPIGNAWSKLPRIIRDLAIELDKKIDLQMNGKETELDRQVLELIKDPLTHMVRNSADHGIEGPEDRKAAGKPEIGTIVLNAFHEGGHIIIEIKDDGKGLALDKIKAKVLENGLATPEELEEMSTQQINQFIFKAGFSTAAAVTAVSGRGVGMDVVRTNIEKIGGTVDLFSEEGKGSTFTIKIPLTLAIVSALIVASSGERFAIPQLAVKELVMTNEKSENRIETIKGAPVFRLRDHLLPLVPLSELLKLSNYDPGTIESLARQAEGNIDALDSVEVASVDGEENEQSAIDDSPGHDSVEKAQSHNKYIIVTQVGSYDFGIIVDRVYDTEEIVVKPVASILRDIELFSGNTILGDGTVIMILDPNGIAKATGEIDSMESSTDTATTAEEVLSDIRTKTSLLLFKTADNAPKTVPLSLVARLENIDLSTIERSSGKMMVQYRGQLMPIMTFDNTMQLAQEGEKPVLVFSNHNQSIGLIVEEIVDITEEYIDVQMESSQPGIVGSAIIEGKATDVIDVGYFLNQFDQKWFADHDDGAYAGRDGRLANGGSVAGIANKKRVLLVDDSPFFRNMLSPLLNVAGYDVTSLESPIEALDLCDKGANFDVIISDIEMPDMDGFEFAQKVKTGSNWEEIPMVALSSHATDEDINRGLEMGFSKYVAKFDRETLLNTLTQTLAGQ